MNRTDGLHLEADGLLQYDIYWRAEPAPARARTQPALIYTPHAHTPTPDASFGRTFYMLLARRKYFGCRPHYRETSLVTRLVTSKVLVIGARNGFARNNLVTTS